MSVIVIIVAVTILVFRSKYPGYSKTKTGLYYHLYSTGKDTVKAKVGDWVSFDVRYSRHASWQTKFFRTVTSFGKAKIRTDSVLFDSKKAIRKPLFLQLMPSDFKGDMLEGIRMMSAGDSASFIVNADSLFKKTFRMPQVPPFIDSTDVVYCNIFMVSVDSPKKMQQMEVQDINKFVTEKNIKVSPSSTGVYYIEQTAGKGMKIDSGKWVTVNFKESTISGKLIFSSAERGKPMVFEYGKRFGTRGFDEGVGKMLKGGKATFLVPSSMAYGETGNSRSGILPFAPVVYDVEIVDVQTMSEEGMKMQKYLKEHHITAKPTPSGLIYVEKVKGTGVQAAPGKKVSVHYTGTLLDGKEFDSSRKQNKPIEFVLGQGQVIPGWDEAIGMMKVGGKATIVVPSKIGYGSSGKAPIPPDATLVFELELVDVK